MVQTSIILALTAWTIILHIYEYSLAFICMGVAMNVVMGTDDYE